MVDATNPKTFVLWFTGLSASGKTTLAREVAGVLRNRGLKVELLDGDIIRDLFPQTGFSQLERDLHIRRVGFLASRLESYGINVIASFISPYRSSRDFSRKLCRNFIEVFVSTPLEICEDRDPKGLYRKARKGEVKQFTGIDDPYEPPEMPELNLDTSRLSVEQSLQLILNRLSV